MQKKHSFSTVFTSTLHDFEKALSRVEGRPDEYGDPRERQVRNFLENILPDSFGVGKGYILNQNEDISDEIDIVLFRKHTCPKFVIDEHLGLRLFPIEDVFGVIEVKSTLGDGELRNTHKKLESVRAVFSNRFANRNDHDFEEQHDHDWKIPFQALFCYQIPQVFDDLDFMFKIHTSNSPDAIFILNHGSYIRKSDDSIARHSSFENRTSLESAQQNVGVLNTITSRFCEDRSRHYDDFYHYPAPKADVLLSLYTHVLDSIQHCHLPHYYSGDYVAMLTTLGRNSEAIGDEDRP